MVGLQWPSLLLGVTPVSLPSSSSSCFVLSRPSPISLALCFLRACIFLSLTVSPFTTTPNRSVSPAPANTEALDGTHSLALKFIAQ